MFEVDLHKVQQGLVMMAIEKALLDFGSDVYEKFLSHLEKKHKAFLADCIYHPEYLSETLTDLYGKSYMDIVGRITTHLLEFSYQKPIERFIVAINPKFEKDSK